MSAKTSVSSIILSETHQFGIWVILEERNKTGGFHFNDKSRFEEITYFPAVKHASATTKNDSGHCRMFSQCCWKDILIVVLTRQTQRRSWKSWT